MVQNVGAALLLAIASAAPAFAGIRLLARGGRGRVVAGIALVLIVAVLPLGYGYALGIGIFGGAFGGLFAIVRYWGAAPTTRKAALLVAEAVLAGGGLAVLTLWQIAQDERFDRCAADRASALIETARSATGAVPPTLHDVAVDDDAYARGTCYVSNGVNWLYRADAQTYTLGYWIDWRVARHVCLRTEGSPDWTCGVERWQAFTPGERD